ncbi:MAG: AI-2E family transporter [bacterium]|nr:AI-2E family transporter [bacterium]MDZ4296099.1 AI-2E family transporter [Patescibacteria group bacterium]
MMARHLVDISYRTLFRITFVVLFLVFLWFVRDIALILVLSIIIASAIAPIANWLQERRVPRALGVLAVYAAAVIVLGAIVYLIVPPLIAEIQRLAERFPTLLQQFFNQVQGSAMRNDNVIFDQVSDYVSEAADRLSLLNPQLFTGNIASGLGAFAALLSTIVGGVVSAIMTVVISFYLAVREKGIENFLRSVVPKEHETYVIGLWQRTQHKMARWVQGQVILALIVGLLVYIGLSLLGIPFAITLALLAAVLELIPMAGPILAGIPAVALGFIESPLLGVLTIALYIVVHQIESHVLAPQVMRRAVGLSPVIVILAILVGAKLYGIMGILLSVPLAAALNELFEDLTERRKNAVV